MFDKLKFWKHSDDFSTDFGKDPLSTPDPMGGMPNDPMQQSPDPLAQAPSDPLQTVDPFSGSQLDQTAQVQPATEGYPQGGTFSHVQHPEMEPMEESSGLTAPQQVSQSGSSGEYHRDQDMELVLERLDSIKHLLANVEHRLGRLEKGGQQKKYW